ncbi:translation initiation factor IF-2, partial [Coemansia sp. RSA 2424]
MKWARPGSARAAHPHHLSNRPIIGGHARNNLKSGHAASSGLVLKPFFEEEVLAKPVSATESRGSATAAEASPGSTAPAVAAQGGGGAARFFFMNRKQGAPAELPSVAWAAKSKPSSTGQSSAQASALSSGPTAANAGSSASSNVPELRATGADVLSGPKRLQERRRPEVKPGKQADQPKTKVDQTKTKVDQTKTKADQSKTKAAPTRGSPLSKQFSRASGALRRSVLDKDDDDEDQAKRRRKRYTLPKKGLEVTLPLTITVDGLAKLLDVANSHLLRKMANIGMDKLASDYLLTNEEAAEIALEYEVTTLLDTLRSSSIAAGEAGGITQHIGAFSVRLRGGQAITFLDTPGHAAFSAMRARGANATDIVVLVVEADDGVMPQTREAIQHALDADVPIIVAINKCDKPGVDPARIRGELLRHGVQTEDLGGDVQAVEISALKGTGVEALAESIATLAEVLDLRAEADIPAHGTVIESQLERGRGGVASVLVKRGTLRVGDVVVAGTAWCKVRAMADDRGCAVAAAGPASAVRVMG